MRDSGLPGRWEGEAYRVAARHHRAEDEWFLDRYRPASADQVVDLGCGTGEFTVRLALLVPEGGVIGVDPDPSMLEVARSRRVANLEFLEGRAEDLDALLPPSSTDLVVSRAVFHWIPLGSYLRCYQAVLSVLRPGGWFHSESAGAGNLALMVRVLDQVARRHGLRRAAATLPDAGTAFDLLEQAGFDIPRNGVRTVAQRRAFTREELAGFVRTQAAGAYLGDEQGSRRTEFLDEAVAVIDSLRRHDGSYHQTFVRLDLLARRPA